MKNILKHKRFLLPAILISGWHLHAQQLPNPADNTPVVVTPPVPEPMQYPGLLNLPAVPGYNYVRTRALEQPVTTLSQLNSLYYTEQTNYFDGLGRPLQSVATKAGPEGKDLVQQSVYDGTGKQSYQYLPIAAPVTISDGKLKMNIKDLVGGFYNSYTNEQPYSKTAFDNSPLNRVLKQFAPGKSWVGSDRGVQMDYRGNTAAEGVRRFTIGYTGTDLPISQGVFNANELLATSTTDEDGKYTLEYTDKLGKLILRKSYLSGASQAHDGFACTYYIYDGMDRLRYVIPPEAVAKHTESGNTWNIPQAVSEGLCFRYLYDSRGRMTEKKIPGKDAEYFVYDQRDRQVMYQDGKLRSQGSWSFSIYDGLNRPVVTGLYKPPVAETRIGLQGYLDNATTYPAGTLLNLLKNYQLYQQYPASLASCQLLSNTYYDNYDQLQSFYFDNTPFAGAPLPANGTVVSSVKSDATRGLLTGTKIRIINPDAPNNNDWLTTANYYDNSGRLIQSQSQNHKGGLDISSNIYFFQGMLWKNILQHQNPAALAIPGTTAAQNAIQLTNTFERSLAIGGGNHQMYQHTQAIGATGAYPLASYTYDHAGRIVSKQTPAGNTLQEYNIRGFLNHILVNNLNNAANTTHIFEENLYYEKGFGNKLYNGNIAGITWKKAGNTAPVEAYGYSYDNLNRLNHAEYRRQNNGATDWTKTTHDYTASNMSYDLNGNLKTMDQRGLDLSMNSSPINMDQLTYTYAPNSNQLVKVSDAVLPIATPTLPDFKDKANQATEYTYDVNGNLIADANKQINSITYDQNNKPEKIDVQNQGTITYVHDAAGNVLQKKVHTNATNADEVYDYLGNFVYKNNVLQYILNEEGRARPIAGANQQTNYVYDYFVKDHLGNVRSTVTAEPMNRDYLATHEIASANVEQLIFDNIPNVRENKPGSTNSNDVMAAGLDGSVPTKRIGTAIMLKTMPGDMFGVSADAFYEGTYEQRNNSSTGQVVESLLSALLGGNTYSGIPLAELPDNVRVVMQTLQNPALASQLDNLLNTSNNPSAPKAHLNVLFFNDKMELVPGSSTAVQVTANNGSAAWNTISAGQQIISPGAGYVLIYIDNQSTDKQVWMDNVMVQHYTSEVLEEEHYYPFGLTLATSKAAAAGEQPLKLTTKELESRFGVNAYDFGARMQDMQLGRWFGVDPLAENREWLSPYNYVQNNPVNRIDPTGAVDDWVQEADGDIKWDRTANSQATTQSGETYLGKTLNFTFNSYIDRKLWDGPNSKAPGDKLTSTVALTGNENANGELTSLSASKRIKIGETPVGTGNDYFPGLGKDQNKFGFSKTSNGSILNFEQHASVSSAERVVLEAIGYDIVNVAQKLTVGVSNNRVSISASTDIFPSATLSVNGRQLFKYNQPSFVNTHGHRGAIGDSILPRGQHPPNSTNVSLRPAPSFKLRFQTSGNN